jgi:uncharacterized protein (DUF885 family)
MGDAAAVELADDFWSYFRSTEQLWNIDRGDVDQIEHWEDLSPDGVADRVSRLTNFAECAECIRREDLNDRARTLMGAVACSARATGSSLPYTRDLSLVAGAFNLMAFLSYMVPGYGLTTRQHGRGYVAKLRSCPSFIDGWIAGLHEGLAVGRCATARGVSSAIAQLDDIIDSDPADDPLVSQEPPAEMSDREVERWRAEIVASVRESVRPALVRLRTMLSESALPGARSDDQPGICHLAGDNDAYAALLHAATSTDLTADEVHEIGRVQLALLDKEYQVLGQVALGAADPAELRGCLRDDPSLRYATPNEVIADAVAALERSQAAVGAWFARLPEATVSPVTVDGGPLAFYTAPSPDGSRGGTFFFNTSDPALWTRFSLEVTTFHESFPGRHLQLALAQELDLHPVLGELEVTSYGEGWGLYAERLADEMSLYSGPLQRLGMLTLDSLRAARLVVDTGLHAHGWTRDEAIDFLVSNTALVPGNAAREIDRYIAGPGQATGYMVGRLEIERLHSHATARLCDQFSLPDFHDAVLGNGMTPLGELGRTIETWINQTTGRRSAPASGSSQQGCGF